MANATRKTPAAEDRRRERLESEIEKLLFAYPYLIKPGLHSPRRQQCISDNDRIDLLFLKTRPPLVVEIKAVKCGVASVRQLLRYLDILRPQHPRIRGILIGRALNPLAARLMQEHAPRVSFLQLEIDIPTPASVVICAACRQAYNGRRPACPCGHEGIIGS